MPKKDKKRTTAEKPGKMKDQKTKSKRARMPSESKATMSKSGRHVELSPERAEQAQTASGSAPSSSRLEELKNNLKDIRINSLTKQLENSRAEVSRLKKLTEQKAQKDSESSLSSDSQTRVDTPVSDGKK